MFGWFERRLDPYPTTEPEQPPKGLVAFCLHYSRGAKRWLIAMAFCSAAIASLEIVMFGFIGGVVDWLGRSDPRTFVEQNGSMLLLMGAVVVLAIPLINGFSSLVVHQTLLGNYPQRIRWMSHRYLIRQSMSYFQDEFAGRIATKLMQTSLAVREVVMKILDMLVYVVFYFGGAVVLAATSDWRLAAPFVLWYARAIGMTIAARLWIRPIFRFSGAGAMARYGGAMILVQFCWFVQSQADVFIAGRLTDAHNLGLYTTALFLTQILAAKFVPPLNEVAFAAYSRIQDDPAMMRAAFHKTVRLIMLVSLPFYFGLAVTAEPLVAVFLGGKWTGAALYALLLFLFARPVIDEMIALVRREPLAA